MEVKFEPRPSVGHEYESVDSVGVSKFRCRHPHQTTVVCQHECANVLSQAQDRILQYVSRHTRLVTVD